MKSFSSEFRSLRHWIDFGRCLITFAFSSIFVTGAIAQNQRQKENFTISRTVTVTRVSDGDSLRSGKLRIRLFGIDAPEKNQQCTNADGDKWACGEAAQKMLEALVANGEGDSKFKWSSMVVR
mgnify:CR=1 FL=1